MYYRTNVSIHVQRMKVIAKEIAEILQKEWISIDIEHLLNLVEVHDDEEIITGDLVSPKKSAFTQAEKEAFEEKCNKAQIEIIKEFWNLFEGELYEKLVKEEKEGSSLYFFILKYIDKLEANMEVCHEIFAGNQEFLELKNITLGIDVSSFGYSYENAWIWLNKLISFLKISREQLEKYDIFNLGNPIIPENIKGNLHTEESLQKDTPYAPYNARKRYLLKGLSGKEKEKLWTQVEL